MPDAFDGSVLIGYAVTGAALSVLLYGIIRAAVTHALRSTRGASRGG